MNPITHLLFDCDGTLVDSETIVMAEMRRAAQLIGLHLTDADCRHFFLGHTRPHCLRMFEQLLGKPLPQDFAGNLAAAIRWRLETELKPVPGIVDTLKLLPQMKCVVSNGSPAHVTLVLEKTGLANQLAKHRYSAVPPCEPKPSPMLYLNVLRHLRIAPQQCIAIEDSVTGVKAAASAGIRTLGFTMLADSKQLLDAGACEVFDDMTTLPALLRALEGVAVGGSWRNVRVPRAR